MTETTTTVTLTPGQREAIFRNIASDVYCYTNFEPESLSAERAGRLMQSLRVLESLGWTADTAADPAQWLEVREPAHIAPVLRALVEGLETALADAGKELGTPPEEVDPEWSAAEGAEYLEGLKRNANRDLDDRSDFLRVLDSIEAS